MSSAAAPSSVCCLGASGSQDSWPHQKLPLAASSRRPFLSAFEWLVWPWSCRAGPRLSSLQVLSPAREAGSHSSKLGFPSPCVELSSHQCCDAWGWSSCQLTAASWGAGSALLSSTSQWPSCHLTCYSLEPLLSTHSTQDLWFCFHHSPRYPDIHFPVCGPNLSCDSACLNGCPVLIIMFSYALSFVLPWETYKVCVCDREWPKKDFLQSCVPFSDNPKYYGAAKHFTN